jgi:flagellar FliL protein
LNRIYGSRLAMCLTIMATSPTVLADSSNSSSSALQTSPSAAKIPLIPILIAIIAAVVVATLGVGAVMYYLARSGRLPVQGGAAKKADIAVVATTHAMVLEPLLVNLSSSGSSSYLRLALTLRVADAGDKKSAKAKDEKSESEKNSDESEAAVRDTVLTVLGRQTPDDLLAADGKDHLKMALRAALAEHNPNLKVTDVFFTDFLVQR